MPHLATDRISRGLRWTGTLLLAAGVVLVVGAIGWTQSADALIAASIVSVLAFGLPGAAAFGLAYWFEYVADRLEQSAAAPRVENATAHPENPFREPLRRYALAVAVVAVAWAARAGLDTFIPQQVPFITFYLAVAVAGWLGGFGPAALATALSLAITWALYLSSAVVAPQPDLGRFVVLGLFVFVCLGIAAITAALHAALARTQQLADELRRQMRSDAGDAQAPRPLADAVPVPVWMTDEQGARTYFNPAWLHLRGRTFEQESGYGWEEGVHPEDLASRRQAFDLAFLQRAPFTLEYRLRDATGEYRLVRDRGGPRYGDDHAFAGYAGALTEAGPDLAPPSSPA